MRHNTYSSAPELTQLIVPCGGGRLRLFLKHAVRICTALMQLRARTTKIWSAVAERSGDTAFRERASFPKRRGASLPAALQILLLQRQQRLAYLCPTVVVLNCDELGYNT